MSEACCTCKGLPVLGSLAVRSLPCTVNSYCFDWRRNGSDESKRQARKTAQGAAASKCWGIKLGLGRATLWQLAFLWGWGGGRIKFSVENFPLEIVHRLFFFIEIFFTGNFFTQTFPEGIFVEFLHEEISRGSFPREQNVSFKFVCLALHRRLEDE